MVPSSNAPRSSADKTKMNRDPPLILLCSSSNGRDPHRPFLSERAIAYIAIATSRRRGALKLLTHGVHVCTERASCLFMYIAHLTPDAPVLHRCVYVPGYARVGARLRNLVLPSSAWSRISSLFQVETFISIADTADSCGCHR